MATNTMKMRIQFRRDTAANWLLCKDVIPAAGEPCFETDTGVFKIGDGVTTYGNLKDIGGACLSADGKSIVIEDGVLKLVGFDAAGTGAQPRKTAEGAIEWVVPSTDTVDGLQTIVTGLQTDVTNLQTNVTNIQEILTPSAEGEIPLLDRVKALEGNVDTLNGDENTDGSVLKIVKDEINSFATKMTEGDTIDTFKELVDYVADHAPEAAQMASDITALQTAVAGKVDAVEGKSLIDDTLIAKLEGIESGAQINKIEAVKVGETLLEIVEKTVTIPIGAGLKTSDEITIADDGTLEIGTININKIVQSADEELVLDGGGAAG